MVAPGFRACGPWRGKGAPYGAAGGLGDAGGDPVPEPAKARLPYDRQIRRQAAGAARLRHPALRRGKRILPLRRPPRAGLIPSAKRDLRTEYLPV